MPIEESTPAIVLHARDYSESDRIVTLLTRDLGKLSGIAKGAKASRRRFENKLEPFSQVTLYFRRRPHGQLVFITRAERGDLPPVRLDDDLGKLALGSYMLELAAAVTSEEAEATAAYRVLTEALAALSTAAATNAMRQAYELKLIGAVGFGLEFSRCRLCATAMSDIDAEAVYFVVARGGVVCQRCRPAAPESAVRIATTSALTLALLSVSPFEATAGTAAAGPDAALAIARFLGTILDRKLRSVDFLNSVL